MLSPMVNITMITSRATTAFAFSPPNLTNDYFSFLFGNSANSKIVDTIVNSERNFRGQRRTERMVIKPRFQNNVNLREIESCHYVYSRDLIRINMNRLCRLVELSNFIRRQIRVKYGKLGGLREKKGKKLHEKCRSIEE